MIGSNIPQVEAVPEKKKMNKLELAKYQLAQARARVVEINNELMAMYVETNDLKQSLRKPHNQAEIFEINVKLANLDALYAQKTSQLKAITVEATEFESELHILESRLANAQRTLNTIDHPPAWGLGDYRAVDIARVRERAARIIEEITQ